MFNQLSNKEEWQEEKIMPIGGQAVIEGVMMRSPERIATAVRRASGEVVVNIQEYQSLIQRHKWLNIPVIRGAITLFEVMFLGIKHLNFSADIAMQDAQAEEAKKDAKRNGKKQKRKGMSRLSTFFTVAFALALGLALFFAFPLFVTTHLFDIEKSAFSFNLIAGLIRIGLFLAYIYLISLMKDVRRLFQYHGAEHKTIYAFEKGLELDVPSVVERPRLHPRCGTSFLVMVMVISLLFFSVWDSLIILLHGNIDLFIRLGTHLPLVTIVAGLSYEAIKASARNPDHPLVKLLISPGLALQRITTQEPDEEMIKIGIVALKAARGEPFDEWLPPSQKPERVAETLTG